MKKTAKIQAENQPKIKKKKFCKIKPHKKMRSALPYQHDDNENTTQL